MLLTLICDPTESLAVQGAPATVGTLDASSTQEALPARAVEKKETEGFYALFLNGMLQPDFVFVIVDDEFRPYMAEKDFRALRFAVAVDAVERGGTEVVPLFDQNGLTAQVDSGRMVLMLDVQPNWYPGTHLNLASPRFRKALPAEPGALLNYSLQITRANEAALSFDSSQSLSIFGPMGLIQVSTAVTSSNAVQPYTSQTGTRFRRLGTTFFRDDEENLATLSLGDGVVESRVGVPAVRYGGISYQSNFGLEPGFSTLESPTIFDQARLPSTIEFLINDRRVGTPVTVAPGPFEISGLPTVDTTGQVQVLIRDALNNERIVSIPYIRSARLYREGLHNFSYTAGLLRPELDRYQTPFFVTAHRYGLTRWLTIDAGATASAVGKSLGIGATFPLLRNVVGDLSVAASRSEAGSGQQFAGSVQWLSGQRTSAGASISHSSQAFRLLGDTGDNQGRLRDDLRLFAAHVLGPDFGSVSATFGRASAWNGETRSITSVGWSKNFDHFSVSVNGVRSKDNTTALLVFNVPLGNRGFLSSSVQKQGADLALRSDYSTQPVTGTGMGYRLGFSQLPSEQGGRQQNYYAGIDARSPFGEHDLDVDVRSDQMSWRARTSGSIGMLSDRPFWGPPISSGFALVGTGEASGIPIYRWNLPVAVSDSRGLALVTNLSPYQENLLAVRPEEVPFEYRITSTEVTAVPRSRGGVFVAFPMYRERPALLVLQLPDSQPVPAGATVTVMKTGETASVGLRGEAYLQDLPERVEIEVRIARRLCRIEVDRPPTDDPQPRLGPYTCVFAEET